MDEEGRLFVAKPDKYAWATGQGGQEEVMIFRLVQGLT